MKVITTASYHATGSSAVTDLLSEFDNIFSTSDKEYRIAHEVDGISDLEFHIVTDNNRNGTSQAIKRFKRLTKRLNGTWYKKDYCLVFGDQFRKIVDEYIEEITELKAKSMCAQDTFNQGEAFTFIDRLYNKVCRTILSFTLRKKTGRRYSLIMPFTYGYYTSISEQEFLFKTRNFFNKLFQIANINKMPFLIMDQLVPVSNIARYTRYFDDISVFVLDRDPRDLFIQESVYSWGVIPVKNVREFCEWYKITRNHRKFESYPNNVMFIQFEDLIYNYDIMVNRIMQFLKISPEHHTKKFSYFDPKYSIKNTNLIKQFPKFKKEIEFIEQNLPEFLYDFNKHIL